MKKFIVKAKIFASTPEIKAKQQRRYTAKIGFKQGQHRSVEDVTGIKSKTKKEMGQSIAGAALEAGHKDMAKETHQRALKQIRNVQPKLVKSTRFIFKAKKVQGPKWHKPSLKEESGEIHRQAKELGIHHSVLRDALKNGKLIQPNKKWMSKIENTNYHDVKNIHHARKYAKEYGRDMSRVEQGFHEGHKMPAPITITHKGKTHLVGGNTRLMGVAAFKTKPTLFHAEIPDDGKVKKSFELEKAKGEGSRGGKVIGHTRSGKPIYDEAHHKGHEKFTHSDHVDAYKAHKKIHNEYADDAKDWNKRSTSEGDHADYMAADAEGGARYHAKQAQKHSKAFDEIMADKEDARLASKKKPTHLDQIMSKLKNKEK